MNFLFLELARTIKELPGIPEVVKIGMIAQAIHDSNNGKSLLATKALNFWAIRHAADLKKHARQFFVRGDIIVYCEFDSLQVAAAAYIKVLMRPQFAGWQNATSTTAFLVFVADKMNRGAADYPRNLISKIPEARAIWGAV